MSKCNTCTLVLENEEDACVCNSSICHGCCSCQDGCGCGCLAAHI